MLQVCIYSCLWDEQISYLDQHEHLRAIPFWYNKRSVAEVHAAAAAEMDVEVKATELKVAAQGRPVNLEEYMRRRGLGGSMWGLVTYADTVVLTPSPFAGLYLPLLPLPMALVSSNLFCATQAGCSLTCFRNIATGLASPRWSHWLTFLCVF